MPITSAMYEGLVRHDGQLADLYMDLKEMNDLIKAFPISDIRAPRVSAQVVDRLPRGGFRDLYEEFDEDVGTTKTREDALSIFGGKFPIDVAMEDWTSLPRIGDDVETQFMLYERSASLDLFDQVINGDVDTDPKSFDGLQKRLENGDQDSANLINCASADVLHPIDGGTQALAYLNFLDQALQEVGLLVAANASAVRGVIMMNREFFLAHQHAVKLVGLTPDSMNLLGYTFPQYQGIPIIRVPVKPDKTAILGNTIDTGSSGGAYSTRIYVARLASAPMVDEFNEQEAVAMLQNPGSDGLQLIQAGMLRRFKPTQAVPEKVYHGFQWQLGISTVTDSSCVAALQNISPLAGS